MNTNGDNEDGKQMGYQERAKDSYSFVFIRG